MVPYGPVITELATPLVVEVAVPAPALLSTKFITVPVVKVPGTLASLESGQPSPSESRSILLIRPSPSISQPLKLNASAEIETLAFCDCDKVPVFWNCKSCEVAVAVKFINLVSQPHPCVGVYWSITVEPNLAVIWPKAVTPNFA